MFEPRRGAQVGEQLGDVARVVLAVAVDLDRDVVAVLERVQVARLDRAADAEVERMREDRHALRAPPLPRSRPSNRRRPRRRRSRCGCWMSAIVPAMAPASLYAGTMARCRFINGTRRGATAKVAVQTQGRRLAPSPAEVG